MAHLEKISVDKKNYEVFKFNSGYFGICKIGSHGGECVFGGDSANEDDYNEEYISNVFANWNGELEESGIYGYRISA